MKKLGLIAAVVLGVACYPGDPTSIQEFDAVLTVRNPNYAFSADLSFYMPDTIVQINADDPDAIDISRAFDDEILAAVRQELLDLGWTELSDGDVDGGAVPDLVVGNLVSATENTQWWVSDPGYCWDPFWCWGWYWPPVVTVTSYDVGSYFVVMAVAEGLTAPGLDDELEIAWSGAANGLLASTTQANVDRLIDGIAQMFAQSPYLSGSSSN